MEMFLENVVRSRHISERVPDISGHALSSNNPIRSISKLTLLQRMTHKLHSLIIVVFSCPRYTTTRVKDVSTRKSLNRNFWEDNSLLGRHTSRTVSQRSDGIAFDDTVYATMISCRTQRYHYRVPTPAR